MVANSLPKVSSVIITMVTLLLIAACGEGAGTAGITRLEGRIFGTFYQVSVAEDLTQDQGNRLHERIRAILDSVDRQMSTYRDDSDLSRLNGASVGSWVELPQPLTNLLGRSRAISETTGGAFDITVGGLVNLWSFGPQARPAKTPSEKALKERLAETGYRNIELEADSGRARRLTDVSVDLSAIAKGHAVDRVGALLEEERHRDFLVNIGGDLLARGRKASGKAWRIGIEVPDDGEQTARHILPLSDIALATSGDYRNYFEEDGQRYSHIIDPRDGRPVQHQLASVSVFHEETTMADALATAFMVMGEDRALTYARGEDVGALLIERHQDGFRTRLSPALEQMLDDDVRARLETD